MQVTNKTLFANIIYKYYYYRHCKCFLICHFFTENLRKNNCENSYKQFFLEKKDKNIKNKKQTLRKDIKTKWG